MEKKHKNRFSIVFNEWDSRQLFAIERLSAVPPRKIAVYIAEAINYYEKRVKNSQLNTSLEKRKRGRPRKRDSLDGVSGNMSDCTRNTLISSSHICQNLKLSDIPSEQSQHGETKDSSMQDNNISVDGEMLDSMMTILGVQ